MRFAALLLLAGLAACGKGSYERIRAIPGKVEISFEAPRDWGKYLNKAGSAQDSWAVEVLPKDQLLVRIDIKKFTPDPKRAGYPVLTAERLMQDTKALKNAVVGPVTSVDANGLRMNRFSDTADYVETSGNAKSPHMKDTTAYFENNGFLYVVSLSAPETDHDKYLPVFEHLLSSLELKPG